MKGLGLVGTGVGVTSLVAPVYHDIDELIASPSAAQNHPWWIKERELENPTVEVDWSLMYRSDGLWTGQQPSCTDYFIGKEERLRRSKIASDFSNNALKNNTPGLDLKASALSGGGLQATALMGFICPQKAATPESKGVPKYQGSPEENSKIVRAATIFYGAAQVGMGEITDRIKAKLLRDKDKAPSNKKYVFEDVPVGYEGTDKLVFPANVPLYDFAMNVPMSKEMYRTSPASNIQGAANGSRYSRFSLIQPRIQLFLAGLGYTCYGYTQVYNGAIPSAAACNLQGLGEGGRNNGVFINAEYGPCVGCFSLVTDLPLAPTNPIDAGIWRFCQTCHKCANACPTGSISNDKEPSWEIPPIYGKADNTHIPGRKEFWTNGIDCWNSKGMYGGCANCMGTCTFNTSQSSIHQIVRATLATTPMFNSYLWNLDNTFSYGLHEDKDAWWHMSQPTYGFDSTIHVKGGNY